MSDIYVSVTQIADMPMLTLRADLSDAKIAEAVKKAVGDVPARNTCAGDLAWMSPDELLVMADAKAKLDNALKGQHHLLVDMSDARAVFELKGAAVREVLAKLTPTDVMALAPGDFRRTRFGQIAGAFWLVDDTTARIICFRSVADYMHLMLTDAAAQGAEVFA